MKKDILPIKINVSSYSGYRVNERPEFIALDNRRLRVRNILEMWVEPEKDYYKVLADDGNVYIISWNRYRDQWFLEKMPDLYSDV